LRYRVGEEPCTVLMKICRGSPVCFIHLIILAVNITVDLP